MTTNTFNYESIPVPINAVWLTDKDTFAVRKIKELIAKVTSVDVKYVTGVHRRDYWAFAITLPATEQAIGVGPWLMTLGDFLVYDPSDENKELFVMDDWEFGSFYRPLRVKKEKK